MYLQGLEVRFFLIDEHVSNANGWLGSIEIIKFCFEYNNICFEYNIKITQKSFSELSDPFLVIWLICVMEAMGPLIQGSIISLVLFLILNYTIVSKRASTMKIWMLLLVKD